MNYVFIDILNDSLRDTLRDIAVYGKDGVKLQIIALLTVLSNTSFADYSNLYTSNKALENAYNDNLFDYLEFVDDGRSGIELVLPREI